MVAQLLLRKRHRNPPLELVTVERDPRRQDGSTLIQKGGRKVQQLALQGPLDEAEDIDRRGHPVQGEDPQEL